MSPRLSFRAAIAFGRSMSDWNINIRENHLKVWSPLHQKAATMPELGGLDGMHAVSLPGLAFLTRQSGQGKATRNCVLVARFEADNQPR